MRGSKRRRRRDAGRVGFGSMHTGAKGESGADPAPTWGAMSRRHRDWPGACEPHSSASARIRVTAPPGARMSSNELE